MFYFWQKKSQHPFLVILFTFMSFLEINEGQSSEERNIIYSQIPVAKESAIVTEFWQQLRGRQESGEGSWWGMGKAQGCPDRRLLAWGSWRRAGSKPRSGMSCVIGEESTLGFLWLVLNWKWGRYYKSCQLFITSRTFFGQSFQKFLFTFMNCHWR